MGTFSGDPRDGYPLLVTAAVIRDRDRVLLAQRPPATHLAGKWEFPGGKLEPGEAPEEGLVREIREELGVEITVDEIFHVVYHRYQRHPILLLAYLCRLKAGSVETGGVTGWQWVTITELLTYDLAPADRPVAEKLLRAAGGSQQLRIF